MRRIGRGSEEPANVIVLTVLDPPLNPLQPATNPLQQVVEVVSDAAGQLSDSFHLLRLAQLILCGSECQLLLALLRDIAGRTVQRAVYRRSRP